MRCYRSLLQILMFVAVVVGAGNGAWGANQAPSFALPSAPLATGGETWVANLAAGRRSWNGTAISADGLTLAATEQNGSVYISADGGGTWTARLTDKARLWAALAMAANGNVLVAAEQQGTLYVSTDAGVTWTARLTDTSRYWISVAASADGTQLMAATYTGALYTSADSGATWVARMPGTSFPFSRVASSADGMKLAVAVSGGSIYTSADAGATWTQRGTGLYTRSWGGLSLSADGSTLAAVDGAYLYVSKDFGAKLPGTLADAFRSWTDVSCSADGTQIAAVTTNTSSHPNSPDLGVILTSNDAGATWVRHLTDTARNWSKISMTADGTRLMAAEFNGYLYLSTGPYQLMVAHNSGPSVVPGIATSISPGPAEDAGQTVSFTVTNDHNEMFTAQPALDSGGNLSFTPAHDALGTLTVTVVAKDNGGTAGGGADTSAAQVFFITILPDHVPTDITLSATSLLENNAPGATVGLLSATDTDLAEGITFTLVNGAGNADNASFTIVGQELKLVSRADYETQDSYAVRVRATNAAGGTFDKAFTISVLDVNEPPQFSLLAAPLETWTPQAPGLAFSALACSADRTHLVAVNSGSYINGGYLFTSADSGVTWTPRKNDVARGWSSVASSADGTRLVAAEAGLRSSYTVPLSGGSIYTSADSGVTWQAALAAGVHTWVCVASSADGMRLVAAEAHGLIYTSSDAGGTWASHASVQAWVSLASSADGLNLVAGVQEGYLYTSTDGGTTWIARMTDKGRNWMALASSADGMKLAAGDYDTAGLYTSANGGATWIRQAGSRLWLSMASSADGTRLVGAKYGGQLYVSQDSGLTWTPRALYSAWTSVVSSADGTLLAAIRSGQIYTSSAVPPTTVPQIGPSGPYTRAGFAFNIAPAPAGEAGQTVTFTVSNDNNALFSVQPAIDSSGTLAFTSVPNATGSANVTVTAHDNGGTANGGVDTSSPRVFVIHVSPNHPPTDISLSTSAVNENSLPGTSVGTFIAADPDSSIGDTAAYALVAGAGDSDNASFTITGGILYLLPTADFETKSSYTIRVRVTDANGATFEKALIISILDVNEPPSFTLPTDSLGPAGENWTAHTPIFAADWGACASSADGTKLCVADYSGAIFTSTDAGVTWTPRMADIIRSWACVASSADGTTLVAGESGGGLGGALGGGLYTSADSGVTWTTRMKSGTLNWTAAAASADGSILAATTANGAVYISTDSGATWTARATSQAWKCITMSADGTHLVAGVGVGSLYTSADGGLTWTARMTDTGRAWTSIASSADGTHLVAVVPGAPLYTSSDSGVTWTARAVSQPWGAVTCSADGMKLVAGALPGYLYTSVDGGVTWVARMTDSSRRWAGLASSVDGSRLLALENYGSIYTSAGLYTLTLQAGGTAFAKDGVVRNIAWGPAGETPQSVFFHVSSDNPALFTSPPAIDSTGRLTLTGTSGITGRAKISVSAQDSGGVANGGVDTSAVQTFYIQTATPASILTDWRTTHFGAATANIGSNEDFNHDGVPNSVEYAFGMSPESGGGGRRPLKYIGTLTGGGTIAQTGQPVSRFEGASRCALWVRRKDYLLSGITYTPQFTSDMSTWVPSTATPNVLADDGTNQIVCVPYPATDSTHGAWFFRMNVGP